MRCWTAVPAALLGGVAGGVLVKKLWLQKYRERGAELEAAVRESDLLYTWLLLDQRGARLDEYFTDRGCKTLAILGMNREGRRFFDALTDCKGVSVAYGVEVDNFAAVHETLTVYRMGDDPLPPADCMVVCDLSGVPEKLAAARREFSGEIVTLSQVLAWLLERHKIMPWHGAVRGWPPAALLPEGEPE